MTVPAAAPQARVTTAASSLLPVSTSTAPGPGVVPSSQRMLRAAAWAGTTIGLVLLIAPLVLALAGFRLIVVDGGSMSPTFAPGDVVIAGNPTGSDLQVGQIVFVGEPPSRYVHRVVEVVDGTAVLQGDANATADTTRITEADVTGTVRGHIGAPWAGAVVTVLLTPGRIGIALGVLALLVALAVSARRPEA